MRNPNVVNTFAPATTTLVRALGLGIASLIAATTLMLTPPQRAEALPAYAQQTKLACGSCHANPSGGGDLKPLGKKFQANGHKLK